MSFFRIVIPNYNSAKWIRKGLESILSQTFDDYSIIVVDDFSTDESLSIIKDIQDEHRDKIAVTMPSMRSGYPGGTRNYGLNPTTKERLAKYIEGHGGTKVSDDRSYTLFMDSDDWLNDIYCLERIHDTAAKADYPDIIRLSFTILESDTKNTYVPLREATMKDITTSAFIAPWTKAVKTNKIVKFPENTLFEDIPHHLAQCDILETCSFVEGPIVVWNRLKSNDVSLTANLTTNPEYKKKLDISYWQLIADLYRLELKHDYANAMRDSWIAFAKGRLKSEGMI